MDFGEMGLDVLVGPAEGEASMVSESEAKGKGPAVDGSSHVKQQRSWAAENEGGPSKVTRNEDLDAPRTMPLHYQRAPVVRSNSGHEQMLSFSNNKSEVNFLRDGVFEREIQVPELPFYQRNTNPPPPPASAAPVYNRSADPTYPPDLNLSLNGLLIRGPFTPSQWMELEHQALIYKYMTHNTPVPSNLLISVKRSLYPLGFPPSSIAWGSYNLGFSGNNDPEPGRCRRTDGKKWRCSRDSVADQKYCERHINRGRHRSRKPVEGQPGQAASGTTNSKGGKITSSMSKSVMPSNGTSNSVKTAQHQLKSLQAAGVTNPPADAFVNRMQDPRGLSMLSAPTVMLKSNNSSLNTTKQAIPVDESSQSEFGLVPTDSLLNPSHRSPYISKDYGGSFLDFSDQETQDQHQLRQFIDDWPKDQSSKSVSTWPDEIKSDWTQLSISIPMTSSEFSSSSSSPTQEKLALSPLSQEFKPTQMNLGVSNDFGQSSEKEINWIPISWRNSMGGPLGEVLTNTASCGMTCNNSTSPLDLLNEEWDGSPQMGSSPTGVLQKSAFCSLSNSSSGSSPRGENNMSFDGASIYDDMLSSTFASSAFPSL